MRELHNNHTPKIVTKNGPIVTALNQIEQGKVGREMLNKYKRAPANPYRERQEQR